MCAKASALSASKQSSVDSQKSNGPTASARFNLMFVYVGSFTTPKRNGHGKGISTSRLSQGGDWTLVQVLEAANPGFLALDSRQRFLYAAHGDSDKVSAYSIDKRSGSLTALNAQITGGHNGLHVTVDPADRHAVVANGGGITVFPINGDGSLAAASEVVTPPRTPGPYRQHQEGSHPHQVSFDPRGGIFSWPLTRGSIACTCIGSMLRPERSCLVKRPMWKVARHRGRATSCFTRPCRSRNSSTSSTAPSRPSAGMQSVVSSRRYRSCPRFRPRLPATTLGLVSCSIPRANSCS